MSLPNRIHRIREFTDHILRRRSALPFTNADLERYVRQVVSAPQLSRMAPQIEARRQALLKTDRVISVTDFGARAGQLSNERRVADITARTCKSPRLAPLLSRTAAFFEAATILELGSSVGISGSYLASDNPSAQVITLEGCPNIATIARESYETLGLTNIECLVGEFGATLPQALEELERVDFAFIDGNHAYEPTMKYFKQILPYTTESSLLVFDDIHWSPGMTRAWREIFASNAVSLTLDFHFFGVAFLDPSLPNQMIVMKP